MANIVASVGSLVEAGMKGLRELADGYYGEEGEDEAEEVDREAVPVTQPVSIQSRRSSDFSSTPSSISNQSSVFSRAPSHPCELVEAVDVPSGWIHLQSTYLDGTGGQRKVRSFGLRNVTERKVEVEIGSDLGGQLMFWAGEDDRPSASSASSTSSTSNNEGSSWFALTLPPSSRTTIFLAFQPQHSAQADQPSPSLSVGGTPRLQPALSRNPSSEVPPIVPSSTSQRQPSSDHGSNGSNPPVAGNIKGTSGAPARRTDPIHRAFSVHGSISIRAKSTSEENSVSPDASHSSQQLLNLPFFATVCRSLFTAALIDPVSGLTSGTQQSSGQLVIDFGSDSVVGSEYHRDILLVNRSEIELVWNTAVVNARHKDAVWFSLRDLDSENVFGVDTSSQPVPLPALSSRHLRLDLRVKAPIVDFDFDFVISNVNQSGNIVPCRAVGSGQAEGTENSLVVLSGTTVDFGQICDGVWAKKLVTCKNNGGRPLDAHFSATPGFEVVFRLAGVAVAGDDMDVDIIEMRRPGRVGTSSSDQLSRTSTRDSVRGRDRSSHPSRGASPSSSLGRGSSFGNGSPNLPGSFSTDLSKHLGALDLERNALGTAVAENPWQASVSGPELSLPPSRPLSGVTSRASSYRYHTSAELDEDDVPEIPFFKGAEPLSTSPVTSQSERMPHVPDAIADKNIPNQMEDLTMRPGTEYRIFVLYRPARDALNPPDIAGALRESTFKVFLDSAPSSQRLPAAKSRRTLNCTAESCTSLIAISPNKRIDFGEVTVGAVKSTTISIANLSALSAKVEIAAISKVLSANRNIIVVPPYETVEEKLEFFPRRINDRYEKQLFVRNLLNRSNDQLVEIRSKNVDVYNLTLHSHLYRILTPSGSNFLDFNHVVINSPSVRSVLFDNVTSAPLVLELSASQPEDVELYVKLEDAPMSKHPGQGKYADDAPLERVISPSHGHLKERFMEAMREIGTKVPSKPSKPKGKVRDKSVPRTGDPEAPKQPVEVVVGTALKRGGRGRPVQLYGNAVVFKDRNLLEPHEYLDLASGPPVASHRSSPYSKKTQLLDSIELEDKLKLSGQHPKVPKLDFAASARATGLLGKDSKGKKLKSTSPGSPKLAADAPPPPSLTAMIAALKSEASVPNGAAKSPALTGKRAEPKAEMFSASDVSKLSVDELLVAFEQQDEKKAAITHSTLEEEERFVRRTISLRKELQNLVSCGKLVPVCNLSVPPQSSRQLVVLMTPNGSTRPHISNRAKRADSRIFIKLAEFDRSLLASSPKDELTDLPVRDLIIRSSCVRSVLEVQQSSINFGGCEKGEVKSKTIVVHNKSDCIGLLRLRTSGSIASGDLKLGLGRYGVISAFGRKEVENFSFTPSLVGNYQETIVVENVLDSFNDQNVAVKANVRRMPAFTVEPSVLDFGSIDTDAKWPRPLNFTLANVSKHERTFVIEIQSAESDAFAEISLNRDDKEAGTALSKEEEEELEGLLQKLKIARRKGKADKITKYESRLAELGVSQGPGAESDINSTDDAFSTLGTPMTEAPPPIKAFVTSIVVTLQPNTKNKILVELRPVSEQLGPLETTIKVHDRKNTDETLGITVTASSSASHHSASSSASATSSASASTDPLHIAIMKHCLQLTLSCPVSPTAFCVGSTLFVPALSPLFQTLRPHFHTFPPGTGDPAGLILGDGYSRQIPGNTHAEANALANFRSRYAELASHNLIPIETVLREAECYATMEPCSVRTSGGPSCALELVRAKVRAVYLGVEEPPDFVQCEGVRILEDGGIVVRRVVGLEEECLKAARRGRS